MSLEYIGIREINGPLVTVEGVENVAYDEIVDIQLQDGTKKTGQVITVSGDRAVVQIFEGSTGMSLVNTSSKFTGHTMQLAVSKEMLGRVFNGVGKPVDDLGEIFPDKNWM